MVRSRPPAERFKNNIIELITIVEELITTVHNSGTTVVQPVLIQIAGSVLSQMDQTDLIETFIICTWYPNLPSKEWNEIKTKKTTHSSASSAYWDQIRLRSEKFFIENSGSIFKGLPMGNVGAFKTLFTAVDPQGTPIIPSEDRNMLWEFFSSLVRICINYIHENRRPQNGVHTENFFPNINIPEQAELWKVKLNFS